MDQVKWRVVSLPRMMISSGIGNRRHPRDRCYHVGRSLTTGSTGLWLTPLFNTLGKLFSWKFNCSASHPTPDQVIRIIVFALCVRIVQQYRYEWMIQNRWVEVGVSWWESFQIHTSSAWGRWFLIKQLFFAIQLTLSPCIDRRFYLTSQDEVCNGTLDCC